MRLRDLLKKLRVRAEHVGRGDRPIDEVDTDALAPNASIGWDSDRFPQNWMPSQQDERPHS